MAQVQTSKKKAVSKKSTPLKPWFHAYTTSALRRIFQWSPSKASAFKAVASSTVFGLYSCENCQSEFTKGDLKVDHVEPVIPVTGFTNWDDYITRLFCGPEDLQILCKSCHDVKTKAENVLRRKFKKEQQANGK